MNTVLYDNIEYSKYQFLNLMAIHTSDIRNFDIVFHKQNSIKDYLYLRGKLTHQIIAGIRLFEYINNICFECKTLYEV